MTVTFPSRAPKDYICPICLGVQGIENDHTLMKQSDIVYKDELVTGFINSFFSGKKNNGFVIVVSNEHFENLYVLPTKYGQRIFEVAQKIAIAMKQAYGCESITTRQNNEPEGDQHAFHFHFHVWPRYKDDGFNKQNPEEKWLAEPELRATYAQRIRAALEEV